MPGEFVSLIPSQMTIGQVYDVLVGTVQPRPIAFVSTLSEAGVPNLAPFSFFMAGGANPPSLVYSPSLNKRGEEKDSLRNVRDTGEFVINILVRDMAPGMNATSFEYPMGHSEWQVSGFEMLPSEAVKPSRVAESPAQFECRLYEIVSHGEGPSAARYVIGEVVRIHLREDVWDGHGIIRESFRPIARLGGPEYYDLAGQEFFTLARPTVDPKPSIES